MLILIICTTTSLSAQITREQADAIVLEYIQEIALPYSLYVNINMPGEEGIIITTFNEEVVRVKYACWAYYLNENPGTSEPAQQRYLFIKENNGNLLEIIISNDLVPEDIASNWKIVTPINPVTNITGVPTTTIVGVPLTLTGTVVPDDATNQTIVWSVNLPDTTGAIIVETDNYLSLHTTAAGMVTLTATIMDGIAAGENYTKDFSIIIEPLGIEKRTISDIQIYPNPTTGELRILNYELGIINYELFDIHGKKFNSKFNPELNSGQNSEFIINIAHLPAGIYFIKIKTETGIITQKIIKN